MRSLLLALAVAFCAETGDAFAPVCTPPHAGRAQWCNRERVRGPLRLRAAAGHAAAASTPPSPAAARPATTPSTGAAASARELMAWLAANGAVLDGVELAASPLQGLGVMATRGLEVGHAAVLVPRRAQLRADSDELHATSHRLAADAAALLHASSSPAVAGKFEEGALAAALLSELSLLRGESCKWTREGGADEGAPAADATPSHYAAYLETLPAMAEMPAAAWLWAEERLEQQATAALAAEATALRRQVEAEFDILAQAGTTRLASGEMMTQEQWLWARALIMSRCLDVFTGLAMLPGIECANHREDAMLEVFVDEEVPTCLFRALARPPSLASLLVTLSHCVCRATSAPANRARCSSSTEMWPHRKKCSFPTAKNPITSCSCTTASASEHPSAGGGRLVTGERESARARARATLL